MSTLFEIIVAIGILTIVVFVLDYLGSLMSRWGIMRNDLAVPTFFITMAPWALLTALFIIGHKWAAAGFIILLIALTGFSVFIGYRIGRSWYHDAYFTAVLGGLIGFIGFGGILAMNMLN